MIDYFALALIHGLLAIALIRLAGNDAVDHDPAFAKEPRQRKRVGEDTPAEPAGDA